MELIEALQTRRAIREFTDEPVDEATIKTLIDDAILAPSSMNHQPWRFAVVLGAERLQKLGLEAKRYAAAHLPADSPLQDHAADPDFEIFHNAPALVIVCAVDKDTQSAEDCSLAAESLMLAAHAMGIGTCPIGLSRSWLNEPAAKAELSIPEEWQVAVPIVLGHRKMVPPPTSRAKPVIVWAR